MPNRVAQARRVLEAAIADRVFPAASVQVGSSQETLWTEAFGSRQFDTPSAPASPATWFDLASLTKVLATTSVAMELVRRGDLTLDEPLGDAFPEWHGRDRAGVVVRDLLEHASGLPARLVDRPPATRREFAHDICTIPLEYTPGRASVYSDLGFILLGFLLEDRGRRPLDQQLQQLAGRTWAGAADLPTFAAASLPSATVAPTLPMDDDPRRGRVLVGEVHDHYAAALGGVAGHAGLFGTAAGVGACARVILGAARGVEEPPPFTAALTRVFTTRNSRLPASSRALGWDTMVPTSSCGSRMSAHAFGHVGFTGTSLWIDPARNRYFVLLSNRTCGGGSVDAIRAVRRAFHDALGDF